MLICFHLQRISSRSLFQSQARSLHIAVQYYKAILEFPSFFDSLLQPIAKKQESHIKNTTDFINFIVNTQISDDVVLATLDVSSLCTNIPQTKGIDVVYRHYEDNYEHNLRIPTDDLRELLRLITYLLT